MKRVLTGLIVLFLFSTGVAYAGGQNDAGKEGPITVSVWSIWGESVQDVNAVAWRKALESAKIDLPNIVIENDNTDPEAYKIKIKTAIAADDAPDVFFAWGAGFVKPFVDAGKVVPLDNYLNDGTLDRIKGGANTNFIFNHNTYGLTYSQWVANLYCNKKLFDAYNLKTPDTFKELLMTVKVFNENSVIPITVGEKDKWPGMFWQNAFAIRTAGAKASNSALSGESSFNTPDFIRSAELLKQLVAADGFVESAMGLDYHEGKALFLNEQAAMFYMGNWFAGTIASQGGDLINHVIIKPFPLVANGKGDVNQFLGGSIDGFCVSEMSDNKDASIVVVKYLTEQMARNIAEAGTGIPTWKTDDIISKDSNSLSLQVFEIIKDSTGYVLAWDTFLSGADAEDHKDYVAELFGQTITAEDFAMKMQTMNE